MKRVLAIAIAALLGCSIGVSTAARVFGAVKDLNRASNC